MTHQVAAVDSMRSLTLAGVSNAIIRLPNTSKPGQTQDQVSGVD